jgi:hypothetical protein
MPKHRPKLAKECAFRQPNNKLNFFLPPFGVLFFRHPQPTQQQLDRNSENLYWTRLDKDGGQKASLLQRFCKKAGSVVN